MGVIPTNMKPGDKRYVLDILTNHGEHTSYITEAQSRAAAVRRVLRRAAFQDGRIEVHVIRVAEIGTHDIKLLA